MTDRSRRALAAAVLAVLAGCGGDATGEPQSSKLSATSPSTPGTSGTPFPASAEPVTVEPGSYRLSSSAWSVADFTATFPEDWTVQYGHVYAKHPDTDEEFGFYAVVVDEIYADACKGSGSDDGDSELVEVGPSVDDLTTALLEQPGPEASGPVATTLGGYPATRIDLTVPKRFDLETCNLADIGLQIWYSQPADKYFVLLADGISSVYIVDVSGQRQVFLTQYRSATSEEDVRELQSVLDSIHIEP